MSFSVPNFNLTCNIYTVTPPSSVVFRASSICNLAMGRRINWLNSQASPSVGTFGATPMLLLPAGTDIRDSSCAPLGDVVEVPAGSGRWYQCLNVDDSGKGFPNEYRMASINKIWNFSVWLPYGIPAWPVPIP